MHSSMTERAREVFALAHDLADRRGDALLRDPAGVPARVLARYGIGLDKVRSEILRVLGQ